MSNFKIDIKRFESPYYAEFQAYFDDTKEGLKPFVEDGLIIIDSEN